MPSVKVNNEEYDVIPDPAVQASKIIADTWVKLGRPQTPFTESGKKMMDVIIAVWEDLYPVDRETYYAQRKEYQGAEMTTQEQVRKQTGRSLGSFPYPIYMMMKKVFRGFDAAERKNMIKIVKLWPIFRMANRV